MRVHADVAVSGKMFWAGYSAVFFDSADELRDVLGNLLRVFAERTNIDDGIVRIVVYVGIGRENPADSGGTSFERGYFTDGVSGLWIVGCGHGHGRRKRSAFVDAHGCARFEIRAD